MIASLCLSPVTVAQAQTVPQRDSGQESAAGVTAEPEETWDRVSPALFLHFLRRITGALETEAAKDDSADKTQREEDDLAAQQEMARWAWWMMVAAFLQAGVGGVGIWYIRRTLQQNRTATEAAVKAAQASEFMLLLSERTAERQLRAYVMIKDAGVEDLTVGEEPRIIIKVKNFGATPAHGFRLWAIGGFSTYPIQTWPTKDALPKHPAPEAPLAPGAEQILPVSFGRILNEKTLEALKAKTHVLYVVGELTYHDIYGVERQTEFCLYCGGPIGIANGITNYHERNNAT